MVNLLYNADKRMIKKTAIQNVITVEGAYYKGSPQSNKNETVVECRK
jgi:hypothetical protein